MESEEKYVPSRFEAVMPMLAEYQFCELKIQQLLKSPNTGTTQMIMAFRAIQRDAKRRMRNALDGETSTLFSDQ